MTTPSLTASDGWAATYGEVGKDWAESICETRDGGYIVAGRTKSFGRGNFDLWVLRLRPDGTVEWQRTYGWLNDDCSHSIQQTSDGGYIVAGDTQSFNGRDDDFWVLKLRSDGSIGPSCRFIRSTNLFVEDGIALAGATRVIPEESDIIPQDSSATVLDTNASASILCP